MDERRGRSGTWPWFALNVILFPVPAHFTLLRVREFGFGRIIRHLGMTFSLVFILLLSAYLQVVYPDIGPWWMLLPVLSGFAMLWANRHLKNEHTPLDPGAVMRPYSGFLPVLLLLFMMVTFLPFLDLIELERDPAHAAELWIRDLPEWQEMIIMVSGLFLLLAGYAVNAGGLLSINRTVILYACFILFNILILIVLVISYRWLRIEGGFVTELAASLLAAFLALDYWDARTFGQYARRFFFLTSTKGITFLFLWLCLLGLPQKTAAEIAGRQFEKMTPDYAGLSPQFLIYRYRDHFNDAHTASRRMRALFTEAFLNKDAERKFRIAALADCGRNGAFPEDGDICRLARRITGEQVGSTSMDFKAVPLFRPIHPHWDVMLTALLAQNTISLSDLDRFIADFKSGLPQSARGRLPDIDAPHEARYVALAAGAQVDFLPPRFETVEALLKKGFHPVVSLRLDGKTYWTTVLYIDHQTGICWVRLTTTGDTAETIQVRFDADEEADFRNDILARMLAPLPIDYLQKALDHCSGPLITFSRDGIHTAFPEQFLKADLETLEKALTSAAAPDRIFEVPAPAPNESPNPFSAYAGYLRVVAAAKAMLEPSRYDKNLFFRPGAEFQPLHGPARLRELETLLDQAAPLRDSDRMEIAALMVEHRHDQQAPDLFLRIAAEKPFSSDLIDCTDALRIGRRLFLMGRHEAADRYLQTASKRHPFYPEFEMWRHIALAKLGRPQDRFRTPPAGKPDLYRYYQTLIDLQNGDEASARRRLEKAIEADSHDSMARHLMHRYFDAPLDERYFFPAPEGL